MAYEIYKIDKNEKIKCENSCCDNLAVYKVKPQHNEIKSEMLVCEDCCYNLFCYEEKEKNIYNPRKEV